MRNLQCILILDVGKLKTQWAILRKKYLKNCNALVQDETAKQWTFFKHMAFLEGGLLLKRNKINIFSTVPSCEVDSDEASNYGNFFITINIHGYILL